MGKFTLGNTTSKPRLLAAVAAPMIQLDVNPSISVDPEIQYVERIVEKIVEVPKIVEVHTAGDTKIVEVEKIVEKYVQVVDIDLLNKVDAHHKRLDHIDNKLSLSNDNLSMKLQKLNDERDEKHNVLKQYTKDLKQDHMIENIKLKHEIKSLHKYMYIAIAVSLVITILGRIL